MKKIHRTYQIIKYKNKNHDKQEKQKDKQKRKKGPAILVFSFILLLVLVFLSIVLYPSLFGTKEVTIPELKGKELDDAITELVNQGLIVGKTIKIEDDTIPADDVIKDKPKGW